MGSVIAYQAVSSRGNKMLNRVRGTVKCDNALQVLQVLSKQLCLRFYFGCPHAVKSYSNARWTRRPWSVEQLNLSKFWRQLTLGILEMTKDVPVTGAHFLRLFQTFPPPIPSSLSSYFAAP